MDQAEKTSIFGILIILLAFVGYFVDGTGFNIFVVGLALIYLVHVLLIQERNY